MHDQACEGNDFFKCDFCRQPWAEDRQMVEGHQGSLICGPCLSVAYAGVVNAGITVAPPEKILCAMCLEDRDDSHWQSPAFPETFVCLRCIKQSARMFEKDPESGWKRPAKRAKS